MDGDKFWGTPECYIHGNTIKYLRVLHEVRFLLKNSAERQDLENYWQAESPCSHLSGLLEVNGQSISKKAYKFAYVRQKTVSSHTLQFAKLSLALNSSFHIYLH